MKSFAFYWALILALLSGISSCAESKFAGTNGEPNGSETATETAGDPGGESAEEPGRDPADDSGGETSEPTDGDEDDSGGCQDGDTIKLKYPEAIQGCIDEGNLYNFDSNVCTDMPESAFECSFENVILELEALGLNSQKVKEGYDKNAKLVGCGQAPDGLTIVAQWWYPPDPEKIDCNFKAKETVITTGCYRHYEGEPPPKPTTQEEIKQFVLDCMNNN